MKTLKGLKEVSNWLFDNPGKKLVSVTLPLCPTGPRELQYGKDYKGCKNINWTIDKRPCDFSVMEDEEWTPVIEPVDFITAYNDCHLTGQKYRGVPVNGDDCDGQIMYNWESKGVWIKDEEVNDITLDIKWIPIDQQE